MSRYNQVCCATTVKGKRCSKKKIHSMDFCWVHTIPEPVICSICYESPLKTESQKLKNCNHIFCLECINDWLLINSSCPNCRCTIDTSERDLCYSYGKKNNKIIDINFTRYSMVGITLDEKLQFMEYFTLFFSFNRYYTTQQWNIVMEYISSNPEIHEIILKSTRIISIDAVRVSDIKAYINISKSTPFLSVAQRT